MSQLLLSLIFVVVPGLYAENFGANLHPQAPPQSSALADANTALEAHDFALALTLLQPLAAANPTDAHILYDLGSAQDALDQTAPATATYRQAIAAQPLYFEPHLALGLLLARNADYPGARTELAVAVTLQADPATKAVAYRSLARLDEQSRPADARDELLEALKLTPETPADTLLSAELAQSATGGAAAAEQQYRRLLAIKPDDPEGAAALGHLLVQQKRAPEAYPILTSALAAHPGDPGLTVELAAAYAADGKPAAAVPLIESLHAADPHDAALTRLLAGLYADSGQWAKAQPLLAVIVAQNPQDTRSADDLGRTLLHLNRPAEAAAVLSRIVAQPRLFPAPAALGDAAGDLAIAANASDNPAAALRALSVRATVLPDSPATLYLAAISYDKLHQTRQAQQAYKTFLAASNGANPDEESQAGERLKTLQHTK